MPTINEMNDAWRPPHHIESEQGQGLIDAAWRFACDAHYLQTRKVTDIPYVTHPIAVAQLVATYTSDVNTIAAALLHDVVEDTQYTLGDLMDFKYGFNHPIVTLVEGMTDDELNGVPRARRKELNRIRLSTKCAQVQLIKYCDIVCNTRDVLAQDKEWARNYLWEKRQCLDLMTAGDPGARRDAFTHLAIAERLVDEYDGP